MDFKKSKVVMQGENKQTNKKTLFPFTDNKQKQKP